MTRTNLIPALALLILSLGCHRSLSKKAFLQVFKDSIARRIPNAKFTIKDDSTLTGEYKGKTLIHSIDNSYAEYLQSPDSIANVLHQYIQTAVDLYNEEELAPSRKNLVATIKPADYPESVQQVPKDAGAKNEFKIAYEKYNDQLIVCYVEDTKSGIAYLPQEDIAKMGIPKDSLLATAQKNLADILPKIELRGDSGIYMITAGGNYEASLILLDFIWTKKNIKVKGDFVIGIPNRDVLLVTGSEDKPAIKQIRKTVENLFNTGSYSVSPDLFIRKNGKFIKFE